MYTTPLVRITYDSIRSSVSDCTLNVKADPRVDKRQSERQRLAPAISLPRRAAESAPQPVRRIAMVGLPLGVRIPFPRRAQKQNSLEDGLSLERQVESKRFIYLGQFSFTQLPNGSHFRLSTGRAQPRGRSRVLDSDDPGAIDDAALWKPTLSGFSDDHERVWSWRECPPKGSNDCSRAETIPYIVLDDDGRPQPALLTSLDRVEFHPVDLALLWRQIPGPPPP